MRVSASPVPRHPVPAAIALTSVRPAQRYRSAPYRPAPGTALQGIRVHGTRRRCLPREAATTTLPPSVGWWSKLPWIVSQLSQQGRQPVGALALLSELLQGLFFVQ